MNEDFEKNELQRAPDKSVKIKFMCDHMPPHPVAGPSHPVPVPMAQNHYEPVPEPSTGSNCVPLGPRNQRSLPISIDDARKFNILRDSVPFSSADRPSYSIPFAAARGDHEQERSVIDNLKDPPNSERENNFDARILEKVESVIRELHDLADTHWKLTSEYDDHIEVLHVKQELLIDKLKDHTAMIEHKLDNSSTGVHQSYHDLLSYMNDSIESVQDFKDLDSRIHDSTITTSDGRGKNVKRGNISPERRGCWTQKKDKGRMHGERRIL